jgi:hypothetical protein
LFCALGLLSGAHWLKRIGGSDSSVLKTVFHPCGSINSPGYFFVVTKVSTYILHRRQGHAA